MASVNPYADTHRGNGSPPPEDDESGFLVPMLNDITRKIEHVTAIAEQTMEQSHLASLERRDLKADIRVIRNGLFVFFGGFLFTIFLLGFIYAIFK